MARAFVGSSMYTISGFSYHCSSKCTNSNSHVLGLNIFAHSHIIFHVILTALLGGLHQEELGGQGEI